VHHCGDTLLTQVLEEGPVVAVVQRVHKLDEVGDVADGRQHVGAVQHALLHRGALEGVHAQQHRVEYKVLERKQLR
jgi:hypothetical protein